MQINSLKIGKRKKRKVVGRGGKSGTYSGRGNKGQKARSGAHVDPLFEGGRSTLIDHLKKKKGFKSKKIKPIVLRISEIEKKFKEGEEISKQSLLEKGFFGSKIKNNNFSVKILGGQEISKKLTVSKDIFLTQSSRKFFSETDAKKGKK